MGLQALIFDVDGAVAETADLHRAAFNRAFQEHGLGWHWDRAIFSQLMPVEFALPKLRLFAMAAQQAGQAPMPDQSALAGIAAAKARIYCRMAREGTALLRPGVARLLQEAHAEGILLAAVSTSTRAEAQTLLSATLGFHTMGWFVSLKTAEDAPAQARERALYRAVLDDLGIKGRRAVAIDDSATGALAASQCGISVIATPGLYTASNGFDMAALTLSDLGHPAEPFSVISGDSLGHSFVSPALLRAIISPSAAAA